MQKNPFKLFPYGVVGANGDPTRFSWDFFNHLPVGLYQSTLDGRIHAADIPVMHRFPLEWHPAQDHYACLTVTDTGSGMDEETVNRIFDPFFSDKFTGRGMGLAVVLGILKASEGGVTVESEPGLGSTFRVFWPIVGF